ncbi:S8 family serine peptidase [Thermosulfidibacter takaii]|nr:S8 family serine peptidase [Thermosulfidibacter takaii]
MVLIVSNCYGMTVTVNPNPAMANQPVTFNVSTQWDTAYSPLTVTVSYGDSKTETELCTNSPCNVNFTHVYKSAGIYLVTVSASCPYSCWIQSPNPVTLSVRVNGSVQIKPTPQFIYAPRDRTIKKTITYYFSSNSDTGTLVSDRGVFYINGKAVLTIPNRLKVTLSGGRGSVTEDLPIQATLTRWAEKYDSNQIVYKRFFRNNFMQQTAEVRVILTTEATSELYIKSIKLYFNNGKAEITVPRKYEGLNTYAQIDYAGSGVLIGYWEVDGRILSHVHRHITFGRSLVLETPSVPKLPTFEEGYHTVRFVIKNPKQDIKFPKAIYYVTSGLVEKPKVIKLLEPKNRGSLEYNAFEFKWKKLSGVNYYTLVVRRMGNAANVLVAVTKRNSYKLSKKLLMEKFDPAETYEWMVYGFDANDRLVGQSEKWVFRFRVQAYVPNEIIIYAKNEELIKVIQDRFRLVLLKKAALRTVKTTAYLFRVDGDVQKVIGKISSTFPSVSVQTNNLYSGLMEPMQALQNVSKVYNLPFVHKNFTGRGVRVAIIDTGVDVQHVDLRNRIASVKNFVTSDYKPEVHGTAVAGIIAASKNHLGIVGIAPEVSLLVLRACKEDNLESICTSFAIAQAIDQAITDDVKIVNMSFGTLQKDVLVESLIKSGFSKGIIFLAPVGNSIWQKKPMFPASLPQVLSVAGRDYTGAWYPSSDLARKADLCVLSKNILATFPGNKYNFVSGTSFASAVASGLVSLAVQKGKLDIDNISKTFEPFSFEVTCPR